MFETFNDLMRAGKKISAVKMLRDEFNTGLLAAKLAVEAIGNTDYGWDNGNPPKAEVYPDLFYILNAKSLKDTTNNEHTLGTNDYFSIISHIRMFDIEKAFAIMVNKVIPDTNCKTAFIVYVRR